MLNVFLMISILQKQIVDDQVICCYFFDYFIMYVILFINYGIYVLL